MTGHTIKLTLVSSSGVDADFACHKDDAAPCRSACVLPGCAEEGCSDPDSHPRTPLGYCNPIEWIENMDPSWYDQYDGPDCTPRNGLIEFDWDGMDWVWRYTEEDNA